VELNDELLPRDDGAAKVGIEKEELRKPEWFAQSRKDAEADPFCSSFVTLPLREPFGGSALS
jgi:hypothetical protein